MVEYPYLDSNPSFISWLIDHVHAWLCDLGVDPGQTSARGVGSASILEISMID
jgi:hypothetical protein